jgi:energy-converting hydrogenase B subunit D
MTDLVTVIFLVFLVACAISVSLIRDLIYAVVIFGAYSLTMSLVWQQFNAPDIAITEAVAGMAVGALMIAVIIRTRRSED